MRTRRLTRTALAVLVGAGVVVPLAACAPELATAEVGACMSSGDLDGEITELPTVGCTQAHDAQVVGRFDLDGDGAFPGTEEITTQASERCATIFEEFVGVALAESTLQVKFVAPTQQSWDGVDDREVLCFATTADGSTVTESWEGAAI